VNFLRHQKKWIGQLALLLFAFGFPFDADAHLVTTGLGPLYDGMGHLLLSPEQWIMVAGLGLLAGMRSPATGRFVLFLLPCAWLAGGCVGQFVRVALSPLFSATALLLVGGLVAADFKAGRNIVVATAGLFGFLAGYVDGVSFGATNAAALSLLGTCVVVFVIIALTAGLVVGVRGWRRIVVRVLGSWMVATGILLVGWVIRKG